MKTREHRQWDPRLKKWVTEATFADAGLDNETPRDRNREEQAARRADHGTGYERSEWVRY